MEFFQESIFTAFLALILSFVVAKIVSFAVSNSPSNGDSAVNEGAVAGGVSLNRGLRVRGKKGQKRVKFVDDVMVRRIDRYEDSDNLEKSDEGVDQFGGFGLNEDSRVEKIDDSEKDEIVIEKEGGSDDMGRVVSEKGKSVIVEEEKIEVGFDENDKKEGNEVMGFGENEGIVAGEEIEESVDDDWEGIERSELEKLFAEAVNYVEYGGRKERGDDHLEKLTSDVQMELYGLHKVAVEGPCGGQQPMALKVSARAKWNAWQRLGSMTQEAAMEQYIRVLSDSIPGWMHDYSADDDIQTKLETVGKISISEHERKSELSSSPVGDSKVNIVQPDDDIQTKVETVGKISVSEHERKSELTSSPVGDSKVDAV